MDLYRILTADNASSLEKQVNGLMKEGYRLHGQPFAFNGGLAQAMVRGN